jgi:hypothetical protein
MLAFVVAFIVSTAPASMPMSFYTGMGDQKFNSKLCVQNYEGGESFVESYKDAEHLERNTQVKTATSEAGGGVLEASINSKVIGKAHIAWRSVDPISGSRGRHAEWGRSTEDLVGVFSIEKFVQLWSNSTCGAISTDWMPCV